MTHRRLRGPATGLLVLAASLLLPFAARAATSVFVSQSGFCGLNFPCVTSIQAGVNAAGGGPSSVFVAPGAYFESVDLSGMGSAPGAGVASNLSIVATDASFSPAPLTSVVIPPAGEAFFNSVTPFPFSVGIHGFVVTSSTTDAIDLEGTSGGVHVSDVVAVGATFDGVDVRADGNITLERVISTLNGNDGFQIELEGPGDLVVTDCTATDNGLPDDERGDDDGFQISLNTGTVEMAGNRALRNGGAGFEFHVRQDGEVPWLRMVDTVSSFNTNKGVHIEQSCSRTSISMQGPDCNGDEQPIVDVTLDGLVVENNGSDGLEMNQGWSRDPSVTPIFQLLNSRAIGNGTGESGDGFEMEPGNRLSEFGAPVPVFSVANALLENLIASGNEADGVELNGNQGVKEALNDVTLLKVVANDNGDDGVELQGSGDFVVIDVEAHRNGFADAVTDDDPRDGIEVGGGGPDPVTITARRIRANDNAGDGIQLLAAERIEASFLEARGNGQGLPDCTTLPDDSEVCDGCVLFTYPSGSTQLFCEPGASSDGLEIEQGTLLDGSAPNVDATVSHCVLSGNKGDGLDAGDDDDDIALMGSLTVMDCHIDDNGDDGLDSHPNDLESPPSPAPPASVSLARISASGNVDDGVDVAAVGAIDLLDVCVSENTGEGIVAKEHGGPLLIADSAALANRIGIALTETSAAPVTLSGSDVAGNTEAGLVNASAPILVAANGNFWGAPTGPWHPNNPAGLGDEIFDSFNGAAGVVDFTGFSPVALGPAECPERAGDTDGDGEPDLTDPCPTVPFESPADSDGDGKPDACDCRCFDAQDVVLSQVDVCADLDVPGGFYTATYSAEDDLFADVLSTTFCRVASPLVPIEPLVLPVTPAQAADCQQNLLLQVQLSDAECSS